MIFNLRLRIGFGILFFVFCHGDLLLFQSNYFTPLHIPLSVLLLETENPWWANRGRRSHTPKFKNSGCFHRYFLKIVSAVADMFSG